MINFKTFAKFFDFLPPELLHSLFIGFLKTQLYKTNNSFENLKIKVFGNEFKNPLGLAAGFDKNAEVIKGAINLGFGFLELGTVTPMPQYGNQKPRVFKIPEIEAVIQRLGFNNKGVEEFLDKLKRAQKIKSILGVNIGKNKNSKDLISDYNFLYQKLEAYSDYITINISSPNTPGLRDIQEKGNIEKLINSLSRIKKKKPTFLKLSPDLSRKNLENICRLVIKNKFLNGLILTNTTIQRDSLYKKPVKNSWKLGEEGGLSGVPLREKTNKIIRSAYELTNGKITIIGVGGISTGKDAFEKISMGASLLQLYTSLIYQGPNVVVRILSDLSCSLKRKGLKNVSDLIGKNINYY